MTSHHVEILHNFPLNSHTVLLVSGLPLRYVEPYYLSLIINPISFEINIRNYLSLFHQISMRLDGAIGNKYF